MAGVTDFLYFLVDTSDDMEAWEDVRDALFDMGEDENYEYDKIVGPIFDTRDILARAGGHGSAQLASARRKRASRGRSVHPVQSRLYGLGASRGLDTGAG